MVRFRGVGMFLNIIPWHPWQKFCSSVGVGYVSTLYVGQFQGLHMVCREWSMPNQGRPCTYVSWVGTTCICKVSKLCMVTVITSTVDPPSKVAYYFSPTV